MKSPGVLALSGFARDVKEGVEARDRDEAGRPEVRSADLGLDLLRDRVEDSVLSVFVGELSSRLDKVNTRLLGRERDRLLFPSCTSPSSLPGLSEPRLVGLLALDLTSAMPPEVIDKSLPLLSPLMRAALSSGLRLRMVSLMFCGMFLASSTFSNALSSSCGLKENSATGVDGADSRDLILKVEIALRTLELRLFFCSVGVSTGV